ncbi:hypothetical protein ACMXYV_00725 [Neptuniibacter sp. SY11_33]|uniref:hypothetical protein n=1 Tax=Neptuniibacter sp. SY11_33 TaxID=3398215 RepID=UPI0039F4E996
MQQAMKWLLLLINLLLLTVGPLSELLEEQMVLHLLFQLPVLVLFGWFAGEMLPKKWQISANQYNWQGITGVVVITVVGLFWMLPSALDAALESNIYDFAKVTSMLLLGCTWSLTRHCIHPLVKGVFLLELWAMLGRFGYLFKVSPDRLCNNYLLGEQQLVGHILLTLSIVIGALWVAKVLFGNNQAQDNTDPPSSPEVKGYLHVCK